MKCESGRSMIEMLGVLAIMGVLTVGAIEMIQMAMNTQKRNTVNEEVLQIVTQVRNLHSEYDDFSNLNTATIFSAIGMSEKNPYDGNYEVAVDSANPRQFVVSITGLSKNECETFVTKGWQDSVGHRLSDGKSSGAMSPENCSASNGRNSVQIIYGE